MLVRVILKFAVLLVLEIGIFILLLHPSLPSRAIAEQGKKHVTFVQGGGLMLLAF